MDGSGELAIEASSLISRYIKQISNAEHRRTDGYGRTNNRREESGSKLSFGGRKTYAYANKHSVQIPTLKAIFR